MKSKYSFFKHVFFLVACWFTCVNTWADGNPYIESLTGEISGNKLTLTATFNNDNISSMVSNVKFHWTRGGEVQSGDNYVFTVDNGAFVTEDIMWEVYATYTYTPQEGESIEKQTAVMEYLQTPPVVTLSGNESGDNLTLTVSFHDYGGLLKNPVYHWVTYTYNADGDVTAENDVIGTATKTVPSLAFEEKIWHAYVTYQKGGDSYKTLSTRFAQQPKPLPTLSVSKVEDKTEGHDMLEMDASLYPDYGTKITNLQYHWSKNGVEQTDYYYAHREVPHAFDTQLWRCWATFTYDGKNYTTNDDTYTYYSTLGQLNFHADKQGNGSILATLDDAASLHEGVTVTYSWKDSNNKTGSGQTYTQQNNAAWVEFTATIKDKTDTSKQLIKHAFYSFDGAHTVVYIKYTGGGTDSNDGKTPETPVATWKKAYSLLNNGGWDQNIIVIVNGTGTGNMIIKDTDTGNKAATITGKWPWDDGNALDQNTAGRIYVSSATASSGARIGAPTRFKNVVFYTATVATARFSCYLNDVEFDEGVVMKNFPDLQTNSGAISGRKSPDFHLQLYGDQYNSGDFLQAENKVMQVTIKSGQFGRILASRIAGTKAKETYIIGRHNNPFKVNMTVDIQDIEFNKKAGGKDYTDDIGYIAAGLTQGMMWGDVTMNIKRGSIATLVAGSQGNALKMGDLKVPVSTYCGRSVINVMAENNSDVVIENYYGGCQGRVYGSDGVCDAYFYGQSTLNMTGGTINADIFASSAGISGLRSADPDYFAKKWYTPDQRIPYPGSYAYGIDYLPYDRNKQIVTMTTHNGTIDLNDTEIKVNISGGVVNNVYGGSFGNSEPLNNVNYAPADAGRLFGNTSVNISGGTVTGNIYGGGAGSTRYYDLATTDAALRQKFLRVAQVYGNTNVTITGMPDIQGNIYGGGAGVASKSLATDETEFREIAKIYGDTNIIFDADYDDEHPFKGNIYGGGEMGGVEGNTNVIIKKGVIVGDVFGGSKGEEKHSNKAKVIGTTKVVIGE